MALRIRQGLSADRLSITPASGELIYTTDTKTLYVGDGTTAGGNVVSGAVPTNLDGLSDVVITSPSNGQVLKFNGTNWINGTDATGGGGGGGSMSDFNISAGDSTQITVTDGDLISIVGDGFTTNVVADNITNTITIGTNFSVSSGIQGQLAFYQTTGSDISPTPPDLIYDEVTQTLFVETLHPNLFLTDNPNFAFINVDNGGIAFGGVLNGTEYTANVGFNDIVGPSVDPAAPFNILVKTVHNEAPVKAMTFSRSRGTLQSEAAVQQNDQIGSMLFSAYDGATFGLAASIGSVVELPPVSGSGVIQAGLYFQTADLAGTLQPALYCDSEQLTTTLKAYRSLPFVANVTSGNVTFTRKQLAGNYIVVIGTPPSPRDLIIPNPGIFLAGIRLVIRNTTTQNCILKSTAGSVIATITPNNHTEVIYTDLDIYPLY